MQRTIDGIQIQVSEEIPEEELLAYAARGREKYGRHLLKMELEMDGEYVNIHYYTDEAIPFNRLRRITGYLVGSLSRWNNAKRAEEHDRVKHT